jgi:oligopeptidase B
MIEAQTVQLQPPVARKDHKETTIHGVTLVDDYAWMRDKENPDVTTYLEAENAYAEAVMAPYADLREDLYREMLSHIKQTDVSVPYRDGLYWYYLRTEEGLQYAIYCRKRGTFSGPAEDAEEEAAGWRTQSTTPASANTRCTSRISKLENCCREP